jgi:membrane protein DedA with SNARE-associated domain
MDNIINFIVGFTDQIGYIGVYIYMFLVGTFIPVPSELILIPNGYLASIGKKSYFLVMLIASLGSLSGALFNYHFAKYLVRKYRDKPIIKKVTKFFEKHGNISVFLVPLTPGFGQYISLPAGISHMSLKYFIPLTFTANLIWVNSILLIGYVLGEKADHKDVIYASIALLVFVIISVTIYVFREIKKES